ncbi:MAG: multifunctional oxoglutarate decarboxylase/oxoglutarate dehydrogenase thiamine pyrophosphate-binding subunit/dihydrolipoyllysine-residue succinyltransferase subunit, partial [Lapillicoccus sp.]
MADPRTTRTDDPLTAFGPNEWLVDDLYQQYLADKSSVDPGWWTFFADYTPQDPAGPAAAPSTNGTSAAPAKPAPATGASNGVAGTPKTEKAPTAPAAKASVAPAAAPAAKAAASPPEAKAAPAKEGTPEARPTPRDVPAVKGVDLADQAQVSPLRGPAARVVTNMEASLHVPTATSVRAVPAK